MIKEDQAGDRAEGMRAGTVTRRLYMCRTGIQMVRSVELPRGRRLVSWHEVGWGWIALAVAGLLVGALVL